jgi:hypothetical protein
LFPSASLGFTASGYGLRLIPVRQSGRGGRFDATAPGQPVGFQWGISALNPSVDVIALDAWGVATIAGHADSICLDFTGAHRVAD